jgi:hypothetical protein
VKLPRIKKKFVAIGLATGLAMGAAGIAAAYFSASGSGTGAGNVGKAATLGVSLTTGGGPLYPTSTATLTFSIKNNGGGNQKVSTETATITHVATPTSGSPTYTQTVIEHTGVAVTGCLASWFIVTTVGTVNTTLGKSGSGSTTTTDTVTIFMVTGTVTQDACQTAHPTVTLHVAK